MPDEPTNQPTEEVINPTSSETPPTTETPPETPPEEESPKSTTEEVPDKVEVDPATLASLETAPLPEGFDSESPLVGKFYELMNDTELTPAERTAQTFALLTEVRESFDAQSEEIWLQTNEAWQNETKKMYGSEENMNVQLGKIAGLIDAFGTDTGEKFAAQNPGVTPPDKSTSLREALTLTGAGNHPVVVEWLVWVSDQLGEGRPLTGAPPASSQSRAQRMFGAAGQST